MARQNGINGKVKAGANFIDGLISWDLTEEHSTSDATAAGETWEDHTPGHNRWSGSMTFRADDDAAANQNIRAGDLLAVEFYSDTDASGKQFFSGSVTVTSHGKRVQDGETVERTYNFQGKGQLSSGTVV